MWKTMLLALALSGLAACQDVEECEEGVGDLSRASRVSPACGPGGL